MTTLNDYFRTEARELLVALERGLQRAPAPDAAELHRTVRGLRGTAQMAREQRVFDIASAFESATKSLANGALAWTEDLARRAHATIDDLRVLLDGVEHEDVLDERVSEAARRWKDPRSAAPAPAPEPADDSTREFREFAAREAAGIADVLDRGIQDLQDDPMDREPLKAILRRQRALLGAARLDEIPVIAEILRAVEDLTRIIAKLDIGVKREWLDIYRVARDGLQSTIAPLLRDEAPAPSHSVSRLRHMRAELLERYGSMDDDASTDGSFIDTTVVAPKPVAAPFIARPGVAQAAAPTASSLVPPMVTPHHETAAPELQADERPVLDLHEEHLVETTTPQAAEELLLTETTQLDEDAPAELLLTEPAGAEVEDETPELLLTELEPAVGDAAEELLLTDVGVQDDADVADELLLTDVGVQDDADVADELLLTDVGVQDDADAAELLLTEPAGEPTGTDSTPPTRDYTLARAARLRDVIAQAVAHDPQARAAVEELFDLIRIAQE